MTSRPRIVALLCLATAQALRPPCSLGAPRGIATAKAGRDRAALVSAAAPSILAAAGLAPLSALAADDLDAAAAAAAAAATAAAPAAFTPRGVTSADLVVFVIGLTPFVWAGVEFWRRIAVGASFGTGADSVVIVEDADELVDGADADQLRRFGGRRVLGKGAILTARVLFAGAGATLLLVLSAFLQLDGARP